MKDFLDTKLAVEKSCTGKTRHGEIGDGAILCVKEKLTVIMISEYWRRFTRIHMV